ncbi:hypothetical protein Droror1_Dr00014303 [Drosera rotundifolia]
MQLKGYCMLLKRSPHLLKCKRSVFSSSISFSYPLPENSLENDYAEGLDPRSRRMEGQMSGPTIPEIVTLCSKFLNGGTDTTGTGIEWAMPRLIENPQIQSRLYEEIHVTVESRKVEEKDVDFMPSLQAFCKELSRKHPPTYFSLPHGVTKPTTLARYAIPAICSIEFFLPGISEDPKLCVLCHLHLSMF